MRVHTGILTVFWNKQHSVSNCFALFVEMETVPKNLGTDGRSVILLTPVINIRSHAGEVWKDVNGFSWMVVSFVEHLEEVIG